MKASFEQLSLGDSKITIVATPGHTPACTSFKIGDNIFVGDSILMPDFGTARCDFPNGCAAQLYAAIQKILSFPPQTQIFVGHDYKAPGRSNYAWQTTVAEQRARNIHLANKTKDEFIEMRTLRDTQLSVPKLMYPSIQLNLFSGRKPAQASNGRSYLSIPLRWDDSQPA